MLSIRSAVETDFEHIYSFDLIAQQETARYEFIRREIAFGNCFAAVKDEKIIGYGVLNYIFYDNGFIDMLYVNSNYRRSGVGLALLQYMESCCRTPKIFTSTNLSNLAMHSLLAKSNYVLSGIIHNLDEKDPEIVYFKQLN